MAPKVAVVLSGCGFLDGSEIHEAVLTLMHLQRHGLETVCVAPSGPQADVIDHRRRAPDTGAGRDILTESARIARGRITDLAELTAAAVDAVALPGGFGAAKNLSDFASQGAAGSVRPELLRLLREVHAAKKPIAALCIAPAVVALALGRTAAPRLTIGRDADTAAALVAAGARHVECAVDDCVVDADNRIVTTPAYMFDARVDEVATGIGKAIDALAGMLREAV
ncbi:MAG: isoprenoid biosynthesis glyoxalase ElbB [Planctomycetes bacterium]|nr:isoprenoid biosynthesis glyoxalase ElbB [Planctomycetota bacterium]